MSFHPGQLVVRTRERAESVVTGAIESHLHPGWVYEVATVYTDGRIVSSPQSVTLRETGPSIGFAACLFRPITEDKLQVFRSLLNPVPIERVQA